VNDFMTTALLLVCTALAFFFIGRLTHSESIKVNEDLGTIHSMFLANEDANINQDYLEILLHAQE